MKNVKCGMQKSDSVPLCLCAFVPFRRGFTLLELLVVISIIAILAGMVIPTFYYAKKRAREAKARVTVKALETAFKAYLDTYKVWPNSVDEVTTYDVADSTVNLFSMLRGSDVALNPQGIAFFEFENMTNYPIAYQNTALDPWSNPSDASSFKAYQVMFDKDYDNKIIVPASAGGGEVYRSVVVWSDGPRDETNIVASWK